MEVVPEEVAVEDQVFQDQAVVEEVMEEVAIEKKVAKVKEEAYLVLEDEIEMKDAKVEADFTEDKD